MLDQQKITILYCRLSNEDAQEGFELVKQGLVGCWLVKDLSRLGRDYLTVGQYTDIIFPSYDVRFIAINDGVDSNRGDSEGFAVICLTSGIPVIPVRKSVSVYGREEPAASTWGSRPMVIVVTRRTRITGFWMKKRPR